MISLFYGKNSNEDEREKKNNIKESSLYTSIHFCLHLNVIIAMKRKDETELMINEIILSQITLNF